ncbi:SgcJ/EcaC family oxidoreductase [Paenibacillus sp. MSJ-34]|uniref:SgcJ/EcaC family oxidoreductase n=1 Tax=Paenibacillus sp. MSJ-34 TaxID=2841529 RepID=UPI001C0F3EA5|nr:SgcJ/EcaC family oxidoreductase [Paenibacillus sp. MSJ-34]MBU5441095.1 SgcJ/EcaC family oxidoreductase [Paenibacillus sp. MSJ-34]
MANREDVEAIQALFAKLTDSWNKGDGAAYGDCFTEDADYVTFAGQHLKGRKQIADTHEWLFNGPLKGSVLESRAASGLQPRFITPDVAIVHAIGEARLANPSEDPNDRGSINTNVAVKRNGEWKLTAFHNCRIQEMPGGKR